MIDVEAHSGKYINNNVCAPTTHATRLNGTHVLLLMLLSFLLAVKVCAFRCSPFRTMDPPRVRERNTTIVIPL